VLTTGRLPLTSQAEGDPMKDNARNVPGSIRSCRTPLSRSLTSNRRFRIVREKCIHYAYKMCQNFKTQILSIQLSITYAFDPQKCTHFPKVLPFSRFDNPTPATESHDARLKTPGECHPFSLGGRLGWGTNQQSFPVARTWQLVLYILYRMGQNGTF